jgi:hypothetical protein
MPQFASYSTILQAHAIAGISICLPAALPITFTPKKRPAHFADGERLELADALAFDAEFPADLVECQGIIPTETEPALDDSELGWREMSQEIRELGAAHPGRQFFLGVLCSVISKQIYERCAFVVVRDRGVERLCAGHRLVDLVNLTGCEPCDLR